jgi:NADH dehydrogenase/NADH:ubiquinone oxidoreductase subunit G
MHCDCRNRLSCGLRQLAEEYDARFARRRMNDRERAEKDLSNSAVVFEPGKCIKCGICVGIADRSGEHPGLTFVNRGMRVRVAVPFDGALDDVPQEILDECAEKCPTGALAFAAGDDEREEG